MKRRILDFFRDDLDEWAAWLDCGHAQHTRHNPPFTNRPWVEMTLGRDSMLGAELDCLKCDRYELPEGLESYQRTPGFDQDSTPAGLTREHRTKTGVWGRIHVLEGKLQYVRRGEPGQQQTLEPGTPGIIAPDSPHHVALSGSVRFYVEFLRVPAAS